MKHKLSEIINTDCYVQFDSNEQLREWVKKAVVTLQYEIESNDTYVRFYSDSDMPGDSFDKIWFPHPIHHHTNIEI
jgi:hypothetical protein